MAKHNAKGAVYGITAALVFTALALPAAASPLLFNVGEAQSAAVSDETFGLGYDLEAMIITTVEQDQRSLYANKGICVADEFTGVMTKPDESSELVGKLYKDAGCEILEAKDGWTKVKSGSCEGYVASQQLITGVEAEEYALKNGVTQLIVKAQESGKEVTLYAEPSSSSSVVTTVKDAQSVTVVGQMADNGWTQVSIGSEKGYLNNASVIFDVKYDTAVSVEEEAKALAEEEAKAEAEAPAEEEAPVQEEESTTPEVEAEAEESAETEAETAVTADAETAEEVTISDVDETVWATTAVNVRKDYTTSSDSLGVLGGGYSIPRTGIVSNGWSRVLYDGETAYIKSEFLTTEQPAVSGDTEINETVYTTTAVNVRQAASTSSEILGLAEAGTKFTRTMESGAWSRIKYDGQDAYIKSEFLTTTAPETAQEPEPEPEPEPEQPAVSDGVTEWYDTVWATTTVNIRSGAGTSYSWVGMLYAGDSIERTGKTDNGWSRVNYNGQTAYINSDYLTTEEPTVQSGSQDTSVGSSSSSDTYSLGQEIANFALQFVGYPYVYGGNSLTGGVDCSGFAQQVYLHFGYSITRTAQAQAGDGTPVSIDSLQPGDLVFYADDDGSIGHVTIYIGGGQVVHASNPSNGIMVSDMYYRTPVWAVRII